MSVNKSIQTIYLFLALVMASCAEQETERRPNIILICVDDMGWSDLGCYGSEINTPNIDWLANNGMRFTNFYNNTKCMPSRASLLTGVYPHDCGYDKTHTNPITNAVTIGEVLREAGYSTYWSGKHHGLENPYNRGFDRYFGLKDGACNHFNPGLQRNGEPKPAQKRSNREWGIDSAIFQPYTPPEKDFYSTDYFTNYALTYLDESKELGKPFFLYLAYTAPHDPLMAWPEDVEKYTGKYNEGYEVIRKKRYQKQLSLGLIDSTYKLSPPSHEPWDSLLPVRKQYESKVMEVYAAMVDRVDQNIGRILKRLDSLGMDENTLILFTSDNGASAEEVHLENDDDQAPIGSVSRWISQEGNWANVSNTPFRYYKNFTFEGGVRTPLVAYWPEKIDPGTYSNHIGHFMDFMPTFVDIAKAQYPETYQGETITPLRGQSLVSALEGSKLNRADPIYWQWKDNQAVLFENWKLVRSDKTSDWQLYDLETDPTETQNMADENKVIVQRLDSMYRSWLFRYE